jgi:hypothetical protein
MPDSSEKCPLFYGSVSADDINIIIRSAPDILKAYACFAVDRRKGISTLNRKRTACGEPQRPGVLSLTLKIFPVILISRDGRPFRSLLLVI